MVVDGSWVTLFTAALGGGVTVKLVDILCQEYKHRKSQSQSAAEFVDRHLDPLLKSLDELVGKLRSLAEADFKTLRGADPNSIQLANNDLSSLVFLFSRFWGQVETIRYDGMSVVMARDSRGKMLQSFFDCLESKKVQLIDRVLQRAAGEAFHRAKGLTTFTSLVGSFESDSETRRWLLPLVTAICRVNHSTERQRLLKYYTILLAMADTLDPEHLVTRKRPPIPGKLSHMTWTDLNYRVFKVYLSFVKHKNTYIGPPKKRSPKKVRQPEET